MRPPTTESTLVVAGSVSGGTVNTSCESTATSASLPGASVPLSRSANSAYAGARVSIVTASAREIAWPGAVGSVTATIR